MLNSSLQDIRYGLRSLRGSPGLTSVAVLTLALGIGANTAIFSVVDAVLYEPQPFLDPDRVVQIWEWTPGSPSERANPMSVDNFADFRDNNRVFDRFAAIRTNALYTHATEELRLIPALHLSTDFFAMTGASTIMGRGFLPEEDSEGASPVALLTHGYWQREFGGGEVLGRTLSFTRWVWTESRYVPIHVEVVGVLSPDFEVPPLRFEAEYRVQNEPEIVLPIGLWDYGKGMRSRGNWGSLRVVAELKEGVEVEQAREDMEAIAAGIAATYPETYGGLRTYVEEVASIPKDRYGPGLFFLWGATAAVLLIVCANVAGLLLGRAIVREREMVVRRALGAGRLTIFRQLLTESAILVALGGLFGVGVAFVGVDVLAGLAPGDIHRLDSAGIDLSVLAFTSLVGVVTVLLCGLVPALRGSGFDVMAPLVGGSRAPMKLRSLRALIVAEVAMALVLLFGAGLMLRSLANLSRVDAGFERANLVAVSLGLPPRALSKYPDAAERSELLSAIRARLRGLPGVVSVAASRFLPLSEFGGGTRITIAGRPADPEEQRRRTDARAVSPGYFETIGTPLLSGRTFTEAEVRDYMESSQSWRTGPAVVSESFARHYWPGERAVGKRFHWGVRDPIALAQDPNADWMTVIGVVADIKSTTLDGTPPLQWYHPGDLAISNLLIRTVSDPKQIVESVRREVAAVDPNEITVDRVRTGEEIFSGAIADSRFRALVLGAFAALALGLTALGLFGVVGYAVSQRTHEIGIRMSLGARSEDVSRLILRDGVKLSALGIVIGLVLCYWLSRYVSSLLFEVAPLDPGTVVAVVASIGVTALAACYLPVRRATRISPMEVLRQA